MKYTLCDKKDKYHCNTIVSSFMPLPIVSMLSLLAFMTNRSVAGFNIVRMHLVILSLDLKKSPYNVLFKTNLKLYSTVH